MAISAYPRVAVEGTTATNNPPNGQSLMLFNAITQEYEPATSATFSGGGDATAANQTTQITEAITTNNSLTVLNSSNFIFGKGNAEYLNDIQFVLLDIKNLLTDIKTQQTSSVQKTQLCDSSGNAVTVTGNKLDVDATP
jgi:pyruvate-formate lyase-activating enzyme